MTIQEAIKSGKRFKRPFEDEFWNIQKNKDGMETPCYESISIKGPMFEPLCVDWLLATDWEIEEKVEITREQFYAAFKRASARQFAEGGIDTHVLARELGFKE